jgi:8-oxo-dGTP pyrophosphatase MutT (NUDIX family)
MEKKQYEFLPFGTKSSRFDCAFVWIYAKNCTPYENYPYNDIPNVSLVLTELRFDGLMGSVGGGVEKDDESFEIAVQREAKEEINLDLDISKLEPLMTIRSPNGTHNHSFSYEVSYEEIQQIRNNAYQGEHFSAENAGVNLVHICRYTKGRDNECGYNLLMKQQFVGTAKIELERLVRSKDLLVNYVDI